MGYERKDDSGATPVDMKAVIAPVMQAFEEFKSTNDARLKEVEKKGASDPLFRDKLDKINKVLDESEGISARLQKAEQVATEIKALDDRFAAIETLLRRKGGTDQPENRKSRVNDFIRAAANSFTIGENSLPAEERKLLTDIAAEFKALSVSTDTAGGYLAPLEYDREIIKGVTETSAVRPLVKVRTIGGKGIELPKRTGQFAAQRVIEGGTKSETTGLTYGLEMVMAPELYALVDITDNMREDSVFDIEAEVSGEAIDQFAVAEGYEFVNGNGIGQLEGLLIAGLQTQGTGSAAITADGVLALKYKVKTAYAQRASFILNRTSLKDMRLLKDNTLQYLWQPGLAQGRPNTIDGEPYSEFPDMPSAGAGLKPVGYGDWNRAYTLVDRIGIQFLRDPFTQATSGKTRYIWRKRVGGKFMLKEAVALLVCT